MGSVEPFGSKPSLRGPAHSRGVPTWLVDVLRWVVHVSTWVVDTGRYKRERKKWSAQSLSDISSIATAELPCTRTFRKMVAHQPRLILRARRRRLQTPPPPSPPCHYCQSEEHPENACPQRAQDLRGKDLLPYNGVPNISSCPF